MAKFIIRFDDLCPEMNRDVWEKIERILDKYQVKAIIAVIPHNEDPHFAFNDYTEMDFWTKIRELQNKGWTIALHGYNHVYINQKSGLLGISANSEFCGLPYEEQAEKIKKGLAIFKDNGVITNTFIAPSHSFDFNTLRALLQNNIRYINDGFFREVTEIKGFVFVPCANWDFKKKKKNGVHTICYHFLNWTQIDIDSFEKDIQEHRSSIVSFEDVVSSPVNNLRLLDIVLYLWKSMSFRMRRIIKSLTRGKK